MDSNLSMKHYVDPDTGDKYWIRPEDTAKETWIELEQPTEIPLPDPNYTPPYTALRINSYPSIADQLDMLWHAMDSGEIPKSNTFYSAIETVKTKFPKH